MSAAIVDVIPPADRLISETDMTVADSGVRRDEEETWLYGGRTRDFRSAVLQSAICLFTAGTSHAGENM
jgi:hypothetical protein